MGNGVYSRDTDVAPVWMGILNNQLIDRDHVLALNPEIAVETVTAVLEGDALDALVSRVDVVVDGTDNFPTRFGLNAACHRLRKPLVSGAAIRFRALDTEVVALIERALAGDRKAVEELRAGYATTMPVYAGIKVERDGVVIADFTDGALLAGSRAA